MRGLFRPVVSKIVGLVSQQVKAARAKKGAAIDVSNSFRHFLSVSV